jgi:environmental stress-induced protein Ves
MTAGWSLVSLDTVQPQPWRNGGGVTRELLVWPGGQMWKARISVADIASTGPFSRFDRVERWFAVLEGNGVDLRIGAGAQRLTSSSSPFCFSGEAPVDCALVDGPTRDFNLMATPGRARMERVHGQLSFGVDGDSLLAVYAHTHPARVSILDMAIEVPPFHLAWCHRSWHAHGIVSGAGAIWLEVKT